MNFDLLNLFKRRANPAASSVNEGGDAAQLGTELDHAERLLTATSLVMGTLKDYDPGYKERLRSYAPMQQRVNRLRTRKCIASVCSAIEEGHTQAKADLAAGRNKLDEAVRAASEVDTRLKARRAAHAALSNQVQEVRRVGQAAIESAEQTLSAAVLADDAAATAAATKQLQQAQRTASKADEDGRATGVQLNVLQGLIAQLEGELTSLQETAVSASKDIELAAVEALALDLDAATYSTMEASLKLVEAGGRLPNHGRLMPFCSAAVLGLLKAPAMQRIQACDTDQLQSLLGSLAVHPDEHLIEAYPFEAQDQQIAKGMAEADRQANHQYQVRDEQRIAAVRAADAERNWQLNQPRVA